MRKIIAAINMTLDGVCDHTVLQPDEEIHRHYQALLEEGDAILYGRVTYQLMEYWRTLLQHPSSEPSMNDFARAMDRIPKWVFSHTLDQVDWDSAKLARRSLAEEVADLKQQSGKPVFVGSRSLILQLMQLHLIDEFQLCVHPVIAGHGMLLFENVTVRIPLKLMNTVTFHSGAVILYYAPDIKESTAS